VSTAKTQSNVKNEIYIVQAGDTMYGISFRAGLNFRDVANWNGIDEPFTIRVGQKIRLTPPQSAIVQSNVTKPTTAKPKSPITTSVPANVPSTEKVLVVENPVAPSMNWQWPTKGKLIGVFVANDKTKQGINISGKSGQKIYAAADGVVVYSGTGLIGYGELIIIKHNNEWISAYAHNEKRLVAEGVKVKAGEHIADMGRTGSSSDMLHFEIRRNGKPVDPLLYLPKR
jgi:lipoprotein NlpD